LHKHIVTTIGAYPFENKWVKQIIAKEIRHQTEKNGGQMIYCCDPFANESFTTKQHDNQFWYTNDLNPKFNTMYNLEANEFSEKMLELNKNTNLEFDLLLFDPPYNLSQLKKQYEGIGKDLEQWQCLRPFDKCKDELARTVKLGGSVIHFGFGSRAFGKRRGFETIAIYNFEPTGTEYRYNIQVVVERKTFPSLEHYADLTSSP
jgi:hypothetical protein